MFASVASATPAITSVSGGGLGTASYDSTRGWGFNVTAAGGINVTHLGLWDANADGLSQSHAIGIWDLSLSVA